MDLLKAVTGSRSKSSMLRVVNWVGNSPSRLTEIVDLFVRGTPEVQIRAAWPLTYCAEHNPERIQPHLKPIIRVLRRKDLHNGVKRSVVRFLQFVDIPKALQGEVANLCFGYLADPGEFPAVRCFSMTVLANLAKENRELQNELRLIIEDQLPYATAAFASRARRTLRVLGGP